MPAVIHWFRRDLRLTDNTALNAARASGHPVVPLYILSTWQAEHAWTGYARQSFLCGSLESLAKNLEAAGSRLIIRAASDAVAALEKLARECGAVAIYTNRDPDPHGQKIEARVAKLVADMGVEFHALQDHALHERGEVLKGDGTPYKVYTPYSKAWYRLEKPRPGPAVRKLEAVPVEIESLDLPTPDHWKLKRPEEFQGHVDAGERAARARMRAFLNGPIADYRETRNFPAAEGTSRLSQDLRWGLISVRELWAGCQQARAEASSPAARQGIDTYCGELAWREFFMMILHHFPEVLEMEFNADYRGLPWSSDSAGLERWQTGRTGFPIVDAAMRQLLQTGFMHNRLRMIVAMFLTKDLHCGWRAGESWFMRHLVDGEIASNNGGWQWSAGTGADAAPYFRIQNPWTQSERFDEEGRFIRQYLPELEGVPAKLLHAPPASGQPLTQDYPAPMLDHAKERERTLGIFKKHKN